MWPFKGIKEWFFPKEYLEYKDNIKDVAGYLPVGDLEILKEYGKRIIPYVKDTDIKNLDNYNGGDLTLKLRFGDCESIAAFYVEVVAHWEGWVSSHIYMLYENGKAHGVAHFINPEGFSYWIDGAVYKGSYKEMFDFYKSVGWDIKEMAVVNDLGETIKEIKI
jgi:hypothetical protein